MERLTEWYGEHAAVVDHHTNYIDRLAEYEDSGMTPAEFREAASMRPQGEWERVHTSRGAAKWSTKVCCSVCRIEGYTRYNYCPNCGAKMR